MSGFDAKRALAFARRLSKPRLAGTEGERAARVEVASALREGGHDAREEPFVFRAAADGWFRLRLAIDHALLVAVAASPYVRWEMGAGAAAAWILWKLASPALERARMEGSVRGMQGDAPGWTHSANVVARADGPAGGPLVIFAAHLDSKSQNISLGAVLVRCAVGGVLAAAVLALAGSALLMPEAPRWAALVPAGLMVFLSLQLYVLRTRNYSPGALDNASGVGALVELARAWPSLAAARSCRAIFLATSAEELGMLGARAWIRAHRAEMPDRFWIVNIDSVGHAGPVRFAPERAPACAGLTATKALRDASRACGVAVEPFPAFFRIATDHTVFVREGWSCVTIMTHGWDVWRAHTASDVAEELSEEALQRTGRLLEALAGRFSQAVS